MANEIKIDLNLTGETTTARGLKNVGDAADKAGDGLTGMAKDAGHLNKKLVETKAEIERLKKAFDDTGDMDILKSLRKEQSNLRVFEGLAKSAVSEAVDVGAKAGTALNKSLTDSLMASKGLIIPPLIAAAVLATPVIGAAISSAVIGAAGAGGIVGGIVAASEDQRVQDAASQVGNRVKDSLVDASAAFVGPVIESLNVLDNAGSRLADNFGQAGSKIAPVLPALASGIAGFADAVGPGFIRAMDAAKPVIRAISHELPKIGDAVSDFFDKISDDPDQAVMGIVAISNAIQGAIDATGSLLDSLGDIFEWSSRSGAALSETWETLFGWMPVAGDAIESQGRNFREQVAAIEGANDASKDYAGEGIQEIIRGEEDAKEATETATEALEDQVKAMDKMLGRFLSAQELASNYQESIDELTKSVQENGTSLDITTEKGRKNNETLRDQVKAAEEIREDIYRRTQDSAAADSAFNQMIETMRRQAIQLGMNKDAVNAFVTALLGASRQWDVEVRAPGLIEAIERAQYLNRLMGGISSGARARAGDTSGYGGGKAAGGDMQAGMLYTVGEQGVELVQMHANGGATVYSNQQTQSMMSGASGGSAAPAMASGGGASGVLRYVGPPGAVADLAASLMTLFRVEIAAQGGNVQTVLGGG